MLKQRTEKQQQMELVIMEQMVLYVYLFTFCEK